MPWFLLAGWAIALCAASACASRTGDYRAVFSQMTPQSWATPGVWTFRILDRDDRPMGDIVLLLTNENPDAGSCANAGWRKAIVIDDTVDFDFGFEKSPAYSVHGRWLTVDLTASICELDHNLVGEIDEQGASGFFNFAHSLGGYNVGKFVATPGGGRPAAEPVDGRKQ